MYLQERDIHFRPLILRTMFSKILPVPVMVVWALLYPSVWSLVAGALVSQTILTLSSHILIPGVPMKFQWDRHHVRDLLGDGKWITLSTAGTFFVSQGDRLILATLLSATQMGFYAIAWTLADVARSFLQRLHGYITLPVLSELFRTRPERAIDAYYRYRKPIDILAFTGTGFLWMAGPEIIHFLYDDRYAEAGWILQVLSLSLASFPFQMINLAFIANDEWRNHSFNSLILSVSFFAAAYVGYALSGSTGVIWAIALYSWPATLILLGAGLPERLGRPCPRDCHAAFCPRRPGPWLCRQVGHGNLAVIKLNVCIVNYKTPQLVIDCLASFLPELAGDAAVVIADSNSQDNSVAKISAWLKGNDPAGKCRLIALPVNGGFSAGYNAAMKACPAEFYLLLNSDTVVRPGAIARLLEAAAEYPQAGLFGPRLEWPDETPQVSCFRDHSPASELIAAARTRQVTALAAAL